MTIFISYIPATKTLRSPSIMTCIKLRIRIDNICHPRNETRQNNYLMSQGNTIAVFRSGKIRGVYVQRGMYIYGALRLFVWNFKHYKINCVDICSDTSTFFTSCVEQCSFLILFLFSLFTTDEALYNPFNTIIPTRHVSFFFFIRRAVNMNKDMIKNLSYCKHLKSK